MSREGWLPPADEGSPPETPDQHAHGDEPDNNDGMSDVGVLDKDDVAMLLVQQFGGCKRGYARERRQAFNRTVSELFSPPRVAAATKLLPSLKLLPGLSFDLTTNDPDDGEPWDFDRPEKRSKCRRIVREQRPILVVGSPMCRAFCSWQRLSMIVGDSDKLLCEKTRALVHLSFCCEIYAMQAREGRYFLHEHPQAAASWQEDAIAKILRIPGVTTTIGDQCQYGLQSPTNNDATIKKATKFMSN